MRIALGIEYNGSRYAGWQRQHHAPSIQQRIEQALSGVANHPVSVVCAGRTDAGVHALQQVVHFDTHSERPLKAWVQGTNTGLPRDIRVLWCQPVSEQFNARRNALARHYRYAILNRAVRPALQHEQLAWFRQPLQIAPMQSAADYLLGEHDFSSFRGSGCQSKSAMRRLDFIRVRRWQDIITIDVVANAFLLHMVRNIVGVLCAVGSGEQAPGWAQQVLAAKDRRQGGITAAAAGLCLVAVYYPQDFELPQISSDYLVFHGELECLDEFVLKSAALPGSRTL